MSSTLKSCSSSASSKMSSLVLGNILEILARASRLAYDVGVAGQSVTGALDQLVIAVWGEGSADAAALGAESVRTACVEEAAWVAAAEWALAGGNPRAVAWLADMGTADRGEALEVLAGGAPTECRELV